MHPLARYTPIGTLILVALVAAAPLWGPGIVNTRRGGDSPFLLQRTHQLVVNLRAGVLPARWMPDAAYGMGYPFFNYYAALPYYLVATLVLLGLDILIALKLIQTLGFVLAGLAMYGWIHTLTTSRRAAWLAGVAYIAAPFHLVNVYVRGDSLSEFYALAFYPLLLWAMDTSLVRRSWTRVTWAYAGLLLTHNISAFIFSPFAGLYLLMLTWQEKHRPTLRDGLLSLAGGFLLAAWFWLPALLELKYVQLGPSTQGYFHYSHHFRADNLIQATFLFDYGVTDGGQTPFSMHWAQAALSLLGWTTLLIQALRRQLPPRRLFILLGLPIATLMITPYSRPLWDHLPFLPVVQFPWRFLSVQALFTAAATAALVTDRSSPSLPGRPVTLTALTLLTLLPLIPLFTSPPDRLLITSADVTTERLQLYELFTGNIGTTIRYEWLPRSVNPRPFTSNILIEPDAPPQAIPIGGAKIEASLVSRTPVRQRWQVQGNGGDLAFPLLYWPGWRASLDGRPLTAYPVPGSGYLAVTVPPGEHLITLTLGHTTVRAFSEALSLLALAAMTVGKRKESRWQIGKWQVIGLMAVLGVGYGLSSTTSAPAIPNASMDFENRPFLHSNPDGIRVGDGRLLTYTLSAESLTPGDLLTVTLGWAEDVPSATLRLVSPAAVRHPELEPLAETSVLTPTLRLPADLPRGLYLIQLGHQYLRPVRVPHGLPLPPETPVLTPFGDAIRLHGVTIAQPTPHHLIIRLCWSTEWTPAANYGISLRLLDSAGQQRVSLDTWPGYGFTPTSLWRPGERIGDRYTLILPDDLPSGDYSLRVILYRMEDAAPIGQAQIGEFTLPLEGHFDARPAPRHFAFPPLPHRAAVEFGGEIRLGGYDLSTAGDALRLTLWWQAVGRPQHDYTVFVHLFDPATESIVAQHDAGPRDGTYPTSWWQPGEVVSETLVLTLSPVPPGDYRLAVGLYDDSLTRLRAVGPGGDPLPDDRYILPEEVRR